MEKKKNSATDKFLNVIETVGNKLPHPATLFLILSLVIIGISAIGDALDWTVTYTGLVKDATGVYKPEEMTVAVQNLLSIEGLNYIFSSMVSNFTGFAPLGTVLVSLIGIGICERSGLISALLRKTAINTPEKILTATIVFLGVMSNAASDAGYVVLPPLAALIFVSFKRNPIAGFAAAFAGVSGGYSANLIISSIDPLLAGITEEAARILVPTYTVTAGANWAFMAASTFLIVLVGTFVTEKIVEPRLGDYKGEALGSFDELTKEELYGLKIAGRASLLSILAGVSLWFGLGSANFLTYIVPVIVVVMTIPGIAYGRAVKSINSDEDVMKMIADSLATMSGYLVLVFFASQFIAYFGYTKLGTMIAVKGAEFLKILNVPSILLIVFFVIIVAFINMFMGSASAKWTILAPVFVPMLMELGLSPEISQLAYRIGDSTTNLISPLMSYFPMMVVFLQRYNKKASLGTLISTMLPYSIAFLITWTVMLVIWFIFNLPIGTDGGIFLASIL